MAFLGECGGGAFRLSSSSLHLATRVLAAYPASWHRLVIIGTMFQIRTVVPSYRRDSETRGGLTAPDAQHPRRRCSVFNDILIDIVALCAFECAQIVARLVWLDASKRHFRSALRAWCLHEAITE